MTLKNPQRRLIKTDANTRVTRTCGRQFMLHLSSEFVRRTFTLNDDSAPYVYSF